MESAGRSERSASRISPNATRKPSKLATPIARRSKPPGGEITSPMNTERIPNSVSLE